MLKSLFLFDYKIECYELICIFKLLLLIKHWLLVYWYCGLVNMLCRYRTNGWVGISWCHRMLQRSKCLWSVVVCRDDALNVVCWRYWLNFFEGCFKSLSRRREATWKLFIHCLAGWRIILRFTILGLHRGINLEVWLWSYLLLGWIFCVSLALLYIFFCI